MLANLRVRGEVIFYLQAPREPVKDGHFGPHVTELVQPRLGVQRLEQTLQCLVKGRVAKILQPGIHHSLLAQCFQFQHRDFLFIVFIIMAFPPRYTLQSCAQASTPESETAGCWYNKRDQ